MPNRQIVYRYLLRAMISRDVPTYSYNIVEAAKQLTLLESVAGITSIRDISLLLLGHAY